MGLTVEQLAKHLGAELLGDGGKEVSYIDTIENADSNGVTFLIDEQYAAKLKKSSAAAVIVGKQIKDIDKPQLIVKNPKAALIETLNFFAPPQIEFLPGIDASAKIGQNSKIAATAFIGPNVVIDDNVQIGDNTVISSGCRIGRNSKLGKNCRLDSNVVVYHDCSVGNNVIIQANTTIGSTGFGYAFIEGAHRLIPHNGGVIIEDFVEIGANTCVDRAKFGNTIIGAGTKIDNLVQIAHNVVIGKCCLICGQVGVSGSCRLGDGVVLAGQVGMADHLEIGSGAVVGAQAGIIGNIEPGAKVVGSPAINVREKFKQISYTTRLGDLFEQLKQLSAKVKELEAAKNDKK
jgi:UDP-3-O-[3-hydroxymyristoyl] glucosamine N-acyltransferase